MIAIFDYGAGNLRSVENTLAEAGAAYTLVRDAGGLRAASKIVLPGVGHFSQIARALDEMDVRQALVERIAAGVPFLGICLGLHVLFEGSEEAPEVRGLGLFPGTIRRFPKTARVPHMGWNTIERCKPARLLDSAEAHPCFYFAHSYYAPVTEATAAACSYSLPFTALLEGGATFGVQFHPEKSGPAGLAVIKCFVDL
ncbi:MAG: imidazole glycerol phosphate synthase subunit HisH [Bryobacterales bacterium]|nr:imidazole glycerol phosphate synthase subunit HisH [Bryobacterales bacterium]